MWERAGHSVACTLPSGRKLIYPAARVEEVPTRWGKTKKSSFTYTHRGQRVVTYGGKITENVTQAVCRDLLAAALVRLQRAGVRTVLHVHDEIVAELDDASELAEMQTLMCREPCWAAGLPLRAEGYCNPRYRK